ncbi:MAG TPA: aminopeptidase N, partial [Pseudolabrys sp.]|nr:aminopeptidase N [Pseudolabrys sp.]
MRTETGKPILLSDYRPPDWLVDRVDLDVSLHPTQARVRATLHLKPHAGTPAPLVLDGDGLTLVSLKLDGEPLATDAYTAAPDRLTIAQPPQRPLTLEIETRVDPTANTQLSGLYRSSGTYCTQCEAEGFRRITYFPDRPDVMAVYTTRIEADRTEAPVLLANGNLIESGDLGNGRHFAVWHDPFKKPSYLFALVGGRLGVVEDTFTTMSGRTVTLKIYVEPGKESLCGYAMDSLKRAMRWDEEAFGREYDLDIFMIVAVSDFNMGAMENKGLNVFNDKLVLASPQTATDGDYARIEGVIAHEYFHNWSGNRITCRDWFQLCLKEGLTVFRDQGFSADQRGHAVQRIKDVRALRARQFPEDAGPLAHPVRPASYLKIDNFYTATIYEKGSEVIRMLKTLIGDQAFRRGMDIYFERCDGAASTVETFLDCFAEASGRDLSQFFTWYEQAGTPEVRLASDYDEEARTLDLTLTQATAPTPGQPTKRPVVAPVTIGLVDRDGVPLTFADPADGRITTEAVLILDKAEAKVRLTGVAREPAISALRGFSAPVRLVTDMPAKSRYVLL